MAKVRLQNLHKRYSGAREEAVKGIDLELEDEKFTVLLGPSGCGKTTTLRMIAGLERPTGGDIYLDGDRVNDVYPGDRDIAMVFQSYALYPHKTVFQNLAFCLQHKGMTRDDISARINEISDMLHLRHLLETYPRALSAGEQQRVAIGRALVRRPKVFLLDEPLANLDALLRAEMRTFLRKLQQDLRITAVHVTHDQIEAQAIGDKVVIMENGLIQQQGTPQQVYNEPANLFVAGFIGTPAMNFFSGQLQRQEGQMVLSSPKSRIPLPEAVSGRLDRAQAPPGVVLGVRPEHLHVFATQVERGVPASVAVVEHRGNELVLNLILGGQIVRVRRDKAHFGFSPQADMSVWVRLPSERTYVFDQQTTARII